MMACGSKCFGMGRGALFTPFGARARASFSRPAMNARSADDLDIACLRGAAAAAAREAARRWSGTFQERIPYGLFVPEVT
jgi:hypothetical protein